ncbi:MAG: hypothetical protein LVR00_06310 [Rhabdochlamydiaceae bacterium]|jgi:hypothetical protein
MDMATQIINTSVLVGGSILDHTLNLAKEAIHKGIISSPRANNCYQRLTGINPREVTTVARTQIRSYLQKAINGLSLFRVTYAFCQLAIGSLTPMGQLTNAVFWLYIHSINNKANKINTDRS